MAEMAPADRMRVRTVDNHLRLISEHLESMQRDVHGLEYLPWKREVDDLWKRVFEQISLMAEQAQRGTLETIREPWTTYITHYGMRGSN